MLKYHDYNLAFGSALRELRVAAGKSQDDLAHDASLDRTYISLLEVGKRSPTLDVMVSLTTALNVSLVTLIELIDKKRAAENNG